MSIIDLEKKIDHGQDLFHFTIYGDPVPLARARMGKHGIWDSQRKIKEDYKELLEDQFGMRGFFQGPIHLELVFYFNLPQSWTIKRRMKMQDRLHYIKPDLSNLIKFIEDIGTGILYKDDCIIASIHAMKKYDHQPRIEGYIRELEYE